MRDQHGNRPQGNKVKTAVIFVLAVTLAAVILVETGAWDKVVATTGLGRSVESSQGLKPGAEEQEHNNLHLPSQAKPSLPPKPQDSTGKQDNKTTGGGTFIPAATSPVPLSQALQDAQSLTEATAHPQGYSRERDFGSWIHAQELCGDGTTRDLILQRDLRDVVLDNRCKVRSGVLDDPYTGKVMQFRYGRDTSGEVQIDHVVALKDAWASGLWRADHAQRVAYANDPDVLLASNGKQNVAKSDGLDYGAKKDPVWLPQNRAWHCDYMAKRVEIKHKYGLSVTSAEKAQTVGILSSCVAGSYQ